MRKKAIIIFYMMSTLIVGGENMSINIKGDVLLRWPRDFVGVAKVPSTIRHIGIEAFSSCKSLVGVELPAALESIGPLAFSDCSRLRDIQVPSSVTNIGSSAFFNCQSLTSIVIRAKIKTIPKGMCDRCCGLRHIDLPNDTVEIGDRAFFGCRSVVGFYIPDSVQQIGRGSFAGCSRLCGVLFPEELRSVGAYAFDGCYDMEFVATHSTMVILSIGAFQNCSRLKRIVVMNELTNVTAEEMAFSAGTHTILDFAHDSGVSVETKSRKMAYDELIGLLKNDSKVAGNLKRDVVKNEMLDGLEGAFRIAADSLVENLSYIPDADKTVYRLDAFAANMFKVYSMGNTDDIKEHLAVHALTSIDVSSWMLVNFDAYGAISLTVEFKDGAITNIVLSEKMKSLIRKKITADNIKVHESILRWLK